MRKEYASRQEERQAVHETASKLLTSLSKEMADVIRMIERRIEAATDKGPAFQREVGYLSGLKFAAAIIELQAIQNDKTMETTLLQLDYSDGVKCKAV